MGNIDSTSIAKGLDDFPSIGKGGEIDLGLGDIGLGLGEIGVGGAVGAGIGVGLADGTARSALDWLKSKGSKGDNLGVDDTNQYGGWASNVPVSGAGRAGGIIYIHDLTGRGTTPSGGGTTPSGGGTTPSGGDQKYPDSDLDDGDISDIFSDAGDVSQKAEDEKTDQIREDETEGREEEDSDDEDDDDDDDDFDKKDKPKDPPGPTFNPDKKPETKTPAVSPVANQMFRSVPVGVSLLRAMKRIPSNNIQPDDFETKEQSRQDKDTIIQIQDDMGSETKNEQLTSIHDRHIRFSQPLFVPRDYDQSPYVHRAEGIPKFEIIPSEMIYNLYTPLGEIEENIYVDTRKDYRTMEFTREILI